jgi:hypothetical protein
MPFPGPAVQPRPMGESFGLKSYEFGKAGPPPPPPPKG